MSDFMMGEHAAEIRSLTVEVAQLRHDVTAIKDMVSELRGGWKVASSIGALVGGLAAFFVNMFMGRHP